MWKNECPRSRRYKAALILTAVASCAAGGQATAQVQLDENAKQQFYMAGFGEHTDNLTRLYDNKVAALVYGVGAGFDLNANHRRVQARLQGDLSYLDSNEDTYSGGALGNIVGRANFAAIPSRVNWFMEGAYGQVPVDARLSDLPTNRQDFTSYRTGPEVSLPLSARDLLRLSGSYSATDYGVSLDDYSRVEESIALRHLLTANQTLSLSGTTNSTRYVRDDVFADYHQDRAFLEWSANGARTGLLLQAGYDVLRSQSDRLGSNLYNLRVTRKIGQQSVLILQADQQLSDTSAAFSRRIDFVGVGGGAVNVSIAPGLFRERSARVSFKTVSSQLEINLSSSYEEDRYQDSSALQANDRDLVLSSLSVFSTLTPSFTMGVFGDMTNADYVRQNFSYTEWDAGLVLSYRLSRFFGVQLSGAHSKRTGGPQSGGFEENVARLGVYYAVGATPLDLHERPGRR